MKKDKRRLGHLVVLASLAAGGISLAKTVYDAVSLPTALNLFAAEAVTFAFLGVVAYAHFGNRDLGHETSETAQTLSRSFVLSLRIVYVVSLSVSLGALWNSLNVPTAPFYLAISCAIGAAGSEIALRSTIERSATYVLLGELTLIGLVVQESFAWLNPNSVYSDMAFHWLGISAIAQTGHIPSALGYYQFFSGFHVLNAVLVEIGLVRLQTYTFVNHLLMTVAVPCSYLLALEVTNRRRALFAALLVVLSLFFFLWVVVLPSLLGATVMILAFYSLLRYHKTRRTTWWVAFWLLALFVLVSHPVNALIMAVVLVVYWMASHLASASRSPAGRAATPTMTYLVLYLSYLSFLALTAFAAFVDSLVASGPRIQYARTYAGPVPVAFVVQSVTSTIGFTALFLPGTFAVLKWLSSGTFPQKLMGGVVAVLTLTAGFTVLSGTGSYGLQAARSLLYLSIFIAPPAAAGMLFLANLIRSRPSRAAIAFAVVVVLSMVSTTSYFTGSGNRILTGAIPIQTSYATDSMLSTRWFLESVPSNNPLALDPVLADYLAPSWSGLGYPYTVYPISHENLLPVDRGLLNDSATLAISGIYVSNSGFIDINKVALDRSSRSRVYDNGVVQVYVYATN
jgi:hypothetical protein